jgi:hypothetical protein
LLALHKKKKVTIKKEEENQCIVKIGKSDIGGWLLEGGLVSVFFFGVYIFSKEIVPPNHSWVEFRPFPFHPISGSKKL